jgi:hypothetical protein
LQPLAPASLDTLLDAQEKLAERSARFATARDGREIWQATFADPSRVPELTVDEFNLQLGEAA